MSTSLYHTLFVVGFLLFMGIRVYYHRRASREGGRMDVRESRAAILLRLALAIPLVGLLTAYLIRPQILDGARVDFPEWASLLGLLLMVVTFPLIVWVQESLGANFNTILGTRERGSLVTHGPYRWVRHPMYSVLFVYMLSILLMTENLLVGGIFLGAFLATIASRIDREEAILEEKYGEDYRHYKRRTPRFLPGGKPAG
jgi:protein-S-isoprenylcysteine O-methyltransferase Ste14